MELAKAGLFLGLLITCCAVVFAVTLYMAMIQVEENIAYMALYYDDMAVDNLHNPEIAIWASAQAWRWCEFYRIEQRTLAWERYFPLCDKIQERNGNLVMCSGTECPPVLLNQEKIQDPARQNWAQNPPYFQFVFSDDYRPMECKLGRETVPCPWD